jgi:hypothetical protein
MPIPMNGSIGGNTHVNGALPSQPNQHAPSLSQQSGRPAQVGRGVQGTFARGRSSSAPPPGLHQRGRTLRRDTDRTGAGSSSTIKADTNEPLSQPHASAQADTGAQASAKPELDENAQQLVDAMKQAEKTNLTMKLMQQQAAQQKMVVDTMTKIGEDQMDSAKRVQDSTKQIFR